MHLVRTLVVAAVLATWLSLWTPMVWLVLALVVALMLERRRADQAIGILERLVSCVEARAGGPHP